jgi:hypothetical protein
MNGLHAPVKYDKSIHHDGYGGFIAVVTEDDDVTPFACEKLEEAQRLLDTFRPDYGEVGEAVMEVPPSVFYPGTP